MCFGQKQSTYAIKPLLRGIPEITYNIRLPVRYIWSINAYAFLLMK
jgi:hypothetical protein